MTDTNTASDSPTPSYKVPFAPGVLGAIEGLLKNPVSLLQTFINNERRHLVLHFVIIALITSASFGIVLGSFSGHEQWWWAPLKISGGLMLSAALCLPSLYVFGCLSGLPMGPGAAASLLLSLTALCGLILLGFAPVAWMFAQSSGSLPLVGFIIIVMWLVAVSFGVGLVRRIAAMFGASNLQHLRLWLGMFMIVTLQMSTTLRPILGRSDTVLPEERIFFMEHWWKNVTAGVNANASDASASTAR